MERRINYEPLLWLIGLGILLTPLFTRNHVYQKLITSPDGLVHTQDVEAFANGSTTKILYPAQAIFGFILSRIVEITHLSSASVFIGFMVTALVGAGFTLYYVFSSLAGKVTGYLAVLLGVFRTNALLALFAYGVAYSLIDMYIVLPFTLYFLVKWLADRKKRYLYFGLLLVALFSSLHVVSIYVPFVVISLLAVMSVYKIITNKPVKMFVITGLLVLLVNSAFSWAFMSKQLIPLYKGLFNSVIMTVSDGEMWRVYLSNFIQVHLSPLVGVVVLLMLFVLIYYRWQLSFTPKVKYLLVICGAMGTLLIVGALLGASGVISKTELDLGQPFRVMLDGVTMLVLCVSVLLGQFWYSSDSRLRWVKMMSLTLIGFSVFFTIVDWVR